jgi:hypothetical protein
VSTIFFGAGTPLAVSLWNWLGYKFITLASKICIEVNGKEINWLQNYQDLSRVILFWLKLLKSQLEPCFTDTWNIHCMPLRYSMNALDHIIHSLNIIFQYRTTNLCRGLIELHKGAIIILHFLLNVLTESGLGLYLSNKFVI